MFLSQQPGWLAVGGVQLVLVVEPAQVSLSVYAVALSPEQVEPSDVHPSGQTSVSSVSTSRSHLGVVPLLAFGTAEALVCGVQVCSFAPTRDSPAARNV